MTLVVDASTLTAVSAFVGAAATSGIGAVMHVRRQARLAHEERVAELRHRLADQYEEHAFQLQGYVLARREAVQLARTPARALPAGWSTSPPALPVDDDPDTSDGPLRIVDLDPAVDAHAAARQQAARAVALLGPADEVEVAIRAAWGLPPAPSAAPPADRLAVTRVTPRRGSRRRLLTAYARIVARQIVDDLTHWR